MAISVIDPIGPAFNHMARILFKPFDIGKWFVLGFCAFLAYLGEGGGFSFPTNWGGMPGGSGRGGGGGGGGGGGPSSQEVINWIKTYLPLIIVFGAIIITAIILIWIVLTWLKCRGKFMVVDGIVRNRGAVVEPWKEFRTLGNSLLGFMLVFGLCSVLVIGLITGVAVLIAWPDIQAQRFGAGALVAILGGFLAFLLTAVVFGFIGFLLEGLVIPTMYLRHERVMTAWSTVRRELIAGHGGTIVLLFLMNIVLSFGVGVVAVIAMCATCCIVLLPYIGTVILLPLYVFMRNYTLCFIEQYGPQWRFFAVASDAPRCLRCGYDLQGLAPSGLCPECGEPFALPGAALPPLSPPTAPPSE